MERSIKSRLITQVLMILISIKVYYTYLVTILTIDASIIEWSLQVAYPIFGLQLQR